MGFNLDSRLDWKPRTLQIETEALARTSAVTKIGQSMDQI